ncbi:hypothetical protein TEA_005145 [Camellia sinensis var. sinensis]|uniref:CHD3-type chromatin-remodeling factor PICKLE n=1 Tax=Camellia sinensis var. sinensis TaxID=542762 RepID=A0A4S4EA66_CAMSN|nr:hypothetical protein TEA_005145 [Camellia sinensis var. sinensis]
MGSLVERLRARSDRKPIYNIDDWDDDADIDHGKSGSGPQKFERIVRADAVCGSARGAVGLRWLSFGLFRMVLVKLRALVKVTPELSFNWVEMAEFWVASPLNEIEKILDCEMRPTVADDSDASKLGSKQIFVKQYLVKWKGLSYLHCTWVPEKEFLKAYKAHPRLRTKVNNFQRQMSSINNSEDEFVAIRPEWTTVDRILACRGDDDEKEYFVKWKELPYDECYWEFESDINSFQQEISRFNKIHSKHRKLSSSKQKSNNRDATEPKNKQKEFQQYEHSPEFLSGGSLHPYQLEGLNFLRFSWSKQTHVILADEMGLGKTIQSIAFLASLAEDNLRRPHLVVAPLSTLRNWEREFATWAPQMNVVMYVGSSQARATIREYEFYFKKNKKSKRKKSGQIVGESKQDRIKFDVLLTSYEMINLDTTSLKPIKWECMIVDEGHRLKNKDSKLFSSMKQYSTKHRVLLTGTPLQNNLDELFMLMHFLDAGKFGSLEEFQEEFKDINQEEQISRLHKMLAPHLLRRVKKDVMKDLPPKKELILRVELSSKQKEYYKAILTRNYDILTRKGGAQVRLQVVISLINVVMELRKLCCHSYMLEGVEPYIEDANESHKQLLESSGKLQLLDKMMVKLKEQGHRVLIYSQFQHMLDLLEDYCSFKKWQYERIDGKVGGAERQIRIDRFNAKNSSRFCFLLSTRAGGLGINLATADTVIIYDSDWNPHADLQAMARAHRLGQTNKVMIYRLITRGTIEERMMQMTKKKMVLEHLVVGRLKAQNINQALAQGLPGPTRKVGPQVNPTIYQVFGSLYTAIGSGHRNNGGEAPVLGMNDTLTPLRKAGSPTLPLHHGQHTVASELASSLSPLGEELDRLSRDEELNDIIRYGSKELFADENDEAGKSRQIHYDDAAIDRLLNRDQLGDEDATMDDEEEDGFLKAFKVANFEYIDEVEAAAEEEARKASTENKTTTNNPDRASYWEELLKDRYEVHKVEEFNAMGKGKRSRKQMVSVEDEDLAGLEDVSSEGEDDNYEAELTDEETTASGILTGRRPYRKKIRVDSAESLPLMEGEGRSFRVKGFNQNQRAAFVQIMMRFGVGEFDWAEFTPRLKQKTCEEIKEYGTLFLTHIAEDITDSPTFSDGVPKEGLRIEDVLVRIAVLLLIRDKGDAKANETPIEEPETEAKVLDIPSPCSMDIDSQTNNQLPQVITSEEISAVACDDKPVRLEIARLYNEMCKVVGENANESVEAYLADKPAGFKNVLPLESIYQDINKILFLVQQNSSSSSEHQILNADSQLVTPTTLQGDYDKSGPEATTENKVPTMESGPQTEPDLEKEKSNSGFDVQGTTTQPVCTTSEAGGDAEMEEKQQDADADTPNHESTGK